MDYAFSGGISIKKLTIGENVRHIGNNTFLNCASIDTINYNAINCNSYYDSIVHLYTNHGWKTYIYITNLL